MKKFVSVIACLFIIGLLQASAGMAKDKGAHYSGVLAVTGGIASGSTTWIDIYVDEFTDQETALKYLVMLKEKGQDALVNELEKKDAGRIVATEGGNVIIAVARKIEHETGTIVRLFITRDLLFLERYEMTRSKDYPIALIELMLDRDGNGQGAIIVAAKVNITDDGSFQLESYGNQYVKVANVRQLE